MIKIAIFASGSGSNAENIIKYFDKNENISIDVIVSNKPDAYIHQRAKNWGIDSVTFKKEDFLKGDKILTLLTERKIDLIVLAGFLLKIPPIIINEYPNRIINIHPALLPKYGGKGMYGDNVHKAVIAAGEKESGITIHYINENYDEGNIIFQVKCTISDRDIYSELAEKVHRLEYEYFPKIIEKVVQQNLL